MIKFPNCKINIGLNIISKREDGYHNLQTVFYPIAIKDAVEIVEFTNPVAVTYTHSGLDILSKEENNLCIKAYHLLKKDFPQLPNIAMHLHKTIPMGAGLGGGSADASFVLMLLNVKFMLGLSQQQLIDYALQLGSDCPFFIVNKPCFATGRGEILNEINLNLSAYKMIVVNPHIHINTGMAFKNIKVGENATNLSTLIQKPIEEWKHFIINDFEKPVFAQYAEIEIIKDQLYKHGALYASMSGSGSTVFGIFNKDIELQMNFPNHYFFRWI